MTTQTFTNFPNLIVGDVLSKSCHKHQEPSGLTETPTIPCGPLRPNYVYPDLSG